jgi:hypothetical protein
MINGRKRVQGVEPPSPGRFPGMVGSVWHRLIEAAQGFLAVVDSRKVSQVGKDGGRFLKLAMVHQREIVSAFVYPRCDFLCKRAEPEQIA